MGLAKKYFLQTIFLGLVLFGQRYDYVAHHYEINKHLFKFVFLSTDIYHYC